MFLCKHEYERRGILVSDSPGPYARAFLGLSLGLRGAPGFSLAFGNCDKYVITDCSSTLGSMISSGAITWNDKQSVEGEVHVQKKQNKHFLLV